MTPPGPDGLEVVDRGAGVVEAAGALTERSADLLRGVALALQDRGHHRVVLDLEGVQTADAAGLRVLRSTQQAMSADLVVLHAPSVTWVPTAVEGAAGAGGAVPAARTLGRPSC